MKRFLICIISLFITTSVCWAQDTKFEKNTKYQKQVMETGFRILNSNQIEKRMTFYFVPKNEIKASIQKKDKQIKIYKGIIPFIESEDEIAAIISQEIAYGLNAHKGLWKRIVMLSRPKTYEINADKIGVDLMVNAGYNPIGMITILNKLVSEPCWFEMYYSKNAGEKRLLKIYDYIYSNYPEYLVDNEYKKNVYYQNFLLTTKQERKEIREKHNIKNVSNKTQENN